MMVLIAILGEIKRKQREENNYREIMRSEDDCEYHDNGYPVVDKFCDEADVADKNEQEEDNDGSRPDYEPTGCEFENDDEEKEKFIKEGICNLMKEIKENPELKEIIIKKQREDNNSDSEYDDGSRPDYEPTGCEFENTEEENEKIRIGEENEKIRIGEENEKIRIEEEDEIEKKINKEGDDLFNYFFNQVKDLNCL